jgi:hypothetical protein
MQYNDIPPNTQPNTPPPQPQLPGSALLLGIGILYIIFGLLNVVLSSIIVTFSDFLDRFLPLVSGMSWSSYFTIMIIIGLYHIFIGIMGVSNRKSVETAKTLRLLGGFDIVFLIICTILSAMGFVGILDGFWDIFNVLYIFGYFVVFLIVVWAGFPILYIIGAQQNLMLIKKPNVE